MSLDDSPAYWVGPHFVNSDFDGAPTMEQGVVLFADSVWGWQLDPAENLMRANPHAGLAVLSIVVSYFERIAQFRKGVVDGRGRSAELFKEGVAWVLEDMADREANERLADRLYDAVRNGLYHDSLVRAGVVLSGELGENVVMQERQAPGGGVETALSPMALIKVIQRHFARYVVDLLNPRNVELRDSFIQAYLAAVPGW